MNKTAPVVGYKTVRKTEIEVETEEWFHWLESTPSFRYECIYGTFTARRYKTYWNAYKKFGGKLRQEYLGKTSDLTVARLEEVARTLKMPDVDYWRMRSERKKVKHKVIDIIDKSGSIIITENPSSYINENSITLNSQLDESVLTDLKKQLTEKEDRIRHAAELLNESLSISSVGMAAVKRKIEEALTYLQPG